VALRSGLKAQVHAVLAKAGVLIAVSGLFDVVRRGHVTKHGSKLVRWAVVEGIPRATTPKIAEDRARTEARRGRNIAKVAAARKLRTLVYHGLRDGHIRALARQAA
jgi:hypothetical protein